jgi:hypothetical protein
VSLLGASVIANVLEVASILARMRWLIVIVIALGVVAAAGWVKFYGARVPRKLGAVLALSAVFAIPGALLYWSPWPNSPWGELGLGAKLLVLAVFYEILVLLVVWLAATTKALTNWIRVDGAGSPLRFGALLLLGAPVALAGIAVLDLLWRAIGPWLTTLAIVALILVIVYLLDRRQVEIFEESDE